jgi:hypothetical protein
MVKISAPEFDGEFCKCEETPFFPYLVDNYPASFREGVEGSALNALRWCTLFMGLACRNFVVFVCHGECSAPPPAAQMQNN